MKSRIAFYLVLVFLYGYLAPTGFAIVKLTESTKSQQVRIALMRIGTGDKTRVSARLRGGSRVKGYIVATNEETFTIRERKTGLLRIVKYSDVGQIRAQNLTRGQKFAIGTAIVVALILTLGWAVGHSD